MAVKIRTEKRNPTYNGIKVSDGALMDIDVLLRPFNRQDVEELLRHRKPITHKLGNYKCSRYILNIKGSTLISVASLDFNKLGRDLAMECEICLGRGKVDVFDEDKKRTITCPHCKANHRKAKLSLAG